MNQQEIIAAGEVALARYMEGIDGMTEEHADHQIGSTNCGCGWHPSCVTRESK